MNKDNKQPRWLVFVPVLFLLLIFGAFVTASYLQMSNGDALIEENQLVLNNAVYGDETGMSDTTKLLHRLNVQPFNLVSLVIFLCAIVHTFLAKPIGKLGDYFLQPGPDGKMQETFGSEIMHFLGEVEVIFGLWVIPLLFSISIFFDWNTAKHFLESRDYQEALFVVVIMAITATTPIIRTAEKILKYIAKLGGESLEAWWLTILIVGPLLGSFITEPGAMTICAFLLLQKFYIYKPSLKLAYGTLGLLFVNISVGGVLTNFAAPPVLMIRKIWDWDTSFMFQNFGINAIIGILLATLFYYFIFRKELKQLDKGIDLGLQKVEQPPKTPIWICFVHVAFLVWMVMNAHYPVILIGSFLLFLGFHTATAYYQQELELKPAVLVGFFLAGLVVHGSLQGWWISPLLEGTGERILMGVSIVLTSFNDNAAITYLSSFVPNLTSEMKYAIVAGAVTGGGLTVIANAPNPAGQSILSHYFVDGVSALNLFLAALIPTLIIAAVFYVPLLKSAFVY